MLFVFVPAQWLHNQLTHTYLNNWEILIQMLKKNYKNAQHNTIYLYADDEPQVEAAKYSHHVYL